MAPVALAILPIFQSLRRTRGEERIQPLPFLKETSLKSTHLYLPQWPELVMWPYILQGGLRSVMFQLSTSMLVQNWGSVSEVKEGEWIVSGQLAISFIK